MKSERIITSISIIFLSVVCLSSCKGIMKTQMIPLSTIKLKGWDLPTNISV